MPYYVTDIADNMGVIINFKEGEMRVNTVKEGKDAGHSRGVLQRAAVLPT